jgi:hypothetical protein
MKRFLVLSVFLALCGLTMVGCGGGGTGSTTLTTSPQAGAVFVTGEDAPLPSVVSLNLTINSVTLTGKSNSPQLVTSPFTVDFARLVGLRAPLGFSAVPADTYSSATLCIVQSRHQLHQRRQSSAGQYAEWHVCQPDQHQSADHVRNREFSDAHGRGC